MLNNKCFKKIIFGFIVLNFSAAFASIAFVNSQHVLEQYKEEIDVKLATEFAKQRNELIKQQNVLKEDIEKLKREEGIISSQEFNKKRSEFELKQEKFQNESMEFQEEFTNKGNAELQKLSDVMKKEIEKIAVAKKIDTVLQANAALYYSDKDDITKQVIAAMNKNR